VASPTAEKWWGKIEAAYGETQRAYHTLEHIDELLVHIGRVSSGATPTHQWHNLDAILLATFFHDVVYDPRAGDNEEQSCAVLEAYAREADMPVGAEGRRPRAALVAAVAVLCTKSHSAEAPGSRGAGLPVEVVSSAGGVSSALVAELSEGELQDIRVFLDADMAILAAGRERYARYARQVAAEFSHLEVPAYRAGRGAFLDALVASGRPVFHTPAFAAENSKAMENMRWEAELLRA